MHARYILNVKNDRSDIPLDLRWVEDQRASNNLVPCLVHTPQAVDDSHPAGNLRSWGVLKAAFFGR